MTGGSDTWLVGFVLAAAACVLAAPLLGRAGWPVAADAAMVLAGIFGVAAFAVAARDTVRAARRRRSPEGPGAGDPRSSSHDPERRQPP